MSRYRKVETAMWADAWFRSASQDAKFVWVYLLTGPRTQALPGLVVATEAVAADDLGWAVKDFKKAFAEASSKGRAMYSPAGLIVLPKALFKAPGEPRPTSRPESPNVLKSWGKLWREIPECGLKEEYLRQFKAFAKALGEGFAKAYSASFPEPSDAPFDESGAGTGAVAGEGTGSPAKPSPPTEALAIATSLYVHVASRPGSKAAREGESKRGETIARWANDVRLLHAQDKVPWDEIKAMVSWLPSEPFWSGVVLSGANLRQHWEQINAKKNGNRSARFGRVDPAPPEAFRDDGGGF